MKKQFRVLAPVLAAATACILGADAVQSQTRDNTAHIRGRAVRAQQQFESFRRRQLPITYGRSGASECDVRIGRFCYWHDDADDPPKEPERVAAARDAFLRALDSVAVLAPQDAWLAGQRVRYLVEAGRAAEALNVARACTAEAWWCSALVGFAQHSLGVYAAADSAFKHALAAMPEKQRCEWTNLTDLLPGGFHKLYRAVPCAQRDSVNAHVWWLADPRWAQGGNDLRSELHARLTMAELVQQARSAHDMAWGADMAELMLRYGWPTSWSRSPPSMHDAGRVSVVGHEPSPSFEFIPSARVLHDAQIAELNDWTPLAERPTTRYAPPYAKHFRALTPQVAWFSRGDSAAVVVGYDVRREHDSVFTRDSAAAAVVVSRGSEDFAIARAAVGPRRGALVVPTARTPALVSVEISDSSDLAFARARFAVQPPTDSGVSDLLLFDGAGELPRTFEEAAGRALGMLTVSRDSPFGLYWELYGAMADATDVTFAISVERPSPGLLRRFAERVRLAQPIRPVQLSFEEQRATGARSLLVDVGHIPAGKYRLTLRVTSATGRSEAVREIEVR
jgi:hypothetical protein